MSKSAKRRARRLNAFVENVDRRTLWQRHDGICQICKTAVSLKEMTIDHWVPLAKGGLHSYANCVPAHEECNIAKGDSLPDDYVHPRPKKTTQKYLNHPALS